MTGGCGNDKRRNDREGTRMTYLCHTLIYLCFGRIDFALALYQYDRALYPFAAQ